MAYKNGTRMQQNTLPPIIDDYVGSQDPVRVYDAFVDALNFRELGIPLTPYKGGAHEYYPKDMVKLLVYGASYGIFSSRKLERAMHHNVSFMWLMGGLTPDYRTIARFRRDHKKAMKNILKQNVRMCLKLGLIDGNSLFVDGSFFRANAGIKNSWDSARCQRHLKDLDEQIDRLVDEGERIDAREDAQESLVEIKEHIQDKEQLKAKIQDILQSLNEPQAPQSVNTTDPDCVKVKGRQGTHAGYNVQLTVDEKHGLIVDSEVTSRNADAHQLSGAVQRAELMLEKKPAKVTCDSGYHALEDLAKIAEDITVIVPSQNQAQEENGHPLGPFNKERFAYDADADQYICPTGKRLKRVINNDNGGRIYRAAAGVCTACVHFGRCTSARQGRIITCLPQEDLRRKLAEIYESPDGQETYRLRKQKVELPFGHTKRNQGFGQFLTRGQPSVNGEFSIQSVCFNLVRMITVIGIPKLLTVLSGMINTS